MGLLQVDGSGGLLLVERTACTGLRAGVGGEDAYRDHLGAETKAQHWFPLS